MRRWVGLLPLLKELLESGKRTPHIDKTCPLSEVITV
jgi:hypothetical protein